MTGAESPATSILGSIMSTQEPAANVTSTLWYYTTVKKLDEVVRQGEIRPAKTGLSKGEKPAVWFSANPEWEPAANEPWESPDGTIERLNKDQTFVLGGGLARIGVGRDVAPHDWKAFKRLSGISSKMAKELYQAAISAGSRPVQWFATFETVPRSSWLSIEVLEGEQWIVSREHSP